MQTLLKCTLWSEPCSLSINVLNTERSCTGESLDIAIIYALMVLHATSKPCALAIKLHPAACAQIRDS